MTITALGDTAVVVGLGAGIDERVLPKVRALVAALERDRPAGIVDVVAAYSTVTVFYDATRLAPGGERAYDQVCRMISERTRHLDSDARKKPAPPARTVEIPVCYGGEAGPDLAEVANHCGLEPEEVIDRHRSADYLVHAIGFLPGFPYLGGLPEKLRTPRRATPRALVPQGSVGIGGQQTGVYPMATPGGWQLIGRTPMPLFRMEEPEPAVLRVGDRVRFRPITNEEFVAWR
ncbi:MAG: Allophanate hydrolase subunit 1 [Verrucomicrobia bacterium]|nr:Allophanate hydrolase subunit 1 [Verrucomicrobiota bacterium]